MAPLPAACRLLSMNMQRRSLSAPLGSRGRGVWFFMSRPRAAGGAQGGAGGDETYDKNGIPEMCIRSTSPRSCRPGEPGGERGTPVANPPYRRPGHLPNPRTWKVFYEEASHAGRRGCPYEAHRWPITHLPGLGVVESGSPGFSPSPCPAHGSRHLRLLPSLYHPTLHDQSRSITGLPCNF